MSFQAVWSFENESTTLLQTEMGWSITSFSNDFWAKVDVDVGWTYTGSPTRYNLCLNDSATATPPTPFLASGHVGCWAAPVKIRHNASAAVVIGRTPLVHQGIGYGVSTYIRVGSINTLQLYVGNQFKGSSQSLDLGLWHYLCLKSDMTTTTWLGEMWIDGVLEASGSQGAVVQSSSSFYLQGGSSYNVGGVGAPEATRFGHLAFWNAYGDTAETPLYATNVNTNEDISEVGTWTSTEATDWQALVPPLNTATKTTEASPTSGERVVTGIKNGGTDDIATQLGITPGSIVGVSLHTWSTGENIGAKAILGHEADANEITGTAVTIDATETTYAHVGSGTKPGGGAWASTSQPRLIYEID